MAPVESHAAIAVPTPSTIKSPISELNISAGAFAVGVILNRPLDVDDFTGNRIAICVGHTHGKFVRLGVDFEE